ncbi:DUF4421 family protein [Paraflavitalea sp. CAU 1676]|uniref:DUF4421 family protein n=1 Tax=Paraflavitalea sp. CAU 1676 TaxID=3032598 RepID=UPI0023DB21CB|nr:DUF4421 family protein [Paraflavitalea sp. CAU 1676]MDF2191482.1 DUF4421 family protein [Paraflavitalea sp. CAU 1676]
MTKYCLLILVGTCCRAWAQAPSADSVRPRAAASKIQTLEEYMTFKFTQSSDIEKLAVKTPNTHIKLSPNAISSSRFGFTYRFIDVGISFVPRFLPGNNDDDEKGTTHSGGISTSFIFRHWLQDLSYKRTKGFYLENTGDFDPTWSPGKPYVKIPDLVFTQFRGATAYNFNPQFSVSAVTTQSERQLKSAGSFIPQFLYRYYVNDDQSEISPNGFTQKGRNWELLLGAGYHYTLVVDQQWYASLGLTPNAGYIFSSFDTRSQTTTVTNHQDNFMFRFDGRAGIGYNGKRFFASAYLHWQNASFRQGHTGASTDDDYAAFQIAAGYRLRAPRWMKTGIENLTRKVGIK